MHQYNPGPLLLLLARYLQLRCKDQDSNNLLILGDLPEFRKRSMSLFVDLERYPAIYLCNIMHTLRRLGILIGQDALSSLIVYLYDSSLTINKYIS